MRRPLFLPTARQTNWLLVICFLAIENPNVALACQADIAHGGIKTWLCTSWQLSVVLFRNEVFGVAALAIALLNLLRPSLVLIAMALAVAGFGVVLHNVDLSALAAGILILSLARPAPAPE